MSNPNPITCTDCDRPMTAREWGGTFGREDGHMHLGDKVSWRCGCVGARLEFDLSEQQEKGKQNER